jgi:hypothetical protein
VDYLLVFPTGCKVQYPFFQSEGYRVCRAAAHPPNQLQGCVARPTIHVQSRTATKLICRSSYCILFGVGSCPVSLFVDQTLVQCRQCSLSTTPVGQCGSYSPFNKVTSLDFGIRRPNKAFSDRLDRADDKERRGKLLRKDTSDWASPLL